MKKCKVCKNHNNGIVTEINDFKSCKLKVEIEKDMKKNNNSLEVRNSDECDRFEQGGLYAPRK